MMRLVIGFFVALPLTAAPAIADRLDRIIAKYGSAGDAPGCAVGVVRNGEVLYRRAFGMADLEHGLRNTQTSAFYIASVSKPFTALATLILVHEGKLRLHDPVRQYIPELPVYTQGITILDLLQHTSGLRDYLEMLRLSGFRNDRRISEDDIREILARQRALNFDPGTEHLYSNSGYVLLSMVVRKVAGVPLREFASKRIFQVFGMAATAYAEDSTDLVPNRSFGYSKTNAAWRVNSFQLDVVGDGGVFTTLNDMLRWAQRFDDFDLGHITPLRLLSSPGRLRSGQPIPYGMGLEAARLGRYSVLQHGGAFGGYNAHFLYIPGERVASITMCNSDTFDAPQLNGSLAAATLPSDAPSTRLTDRTHPPVPEAVGTRVAGYYRGDRGEYIQLELRHTDLVLKTRKGQHPLFLASGTTLQSRIDAMVRVRFSADTGEPVMLRTPNREERLARVTPGGPNGMDLSLFVGRYRSDEANTTIIVESQPGRLSWRAQHGAATAMHFVSPGEFASGPGRIRFLYGDHGRIDGLLFDGARIRGLLFRRDN